MATPLTARIRAEFESALASQQANAPEIGQRRQHLLGALTPDLPRNRDDGFRYAPLRGLDKLAFSPLRNSVDSPGANARARTAALLPPIPSHFARCVFVDGQWSSALSSPELIALGEHRQLTWQGARLSRHTGDDASLSPVVVRKEAPHAAASGTTSPPGQRFALLNAAFATQSLHIDVAGGGDKTHVEVVFVSLEDGKTAASYPRLIVSTAEDSHLVLIERHIGDADGAGFSNACIELDLGERSRCNHYRLHSQGKHATHIETLRSRLGTQAQYQLLAVHAGAAASRSTIDVELAGTGSGLTVHAAQVAAHMQVFDTQLTVEHRGAATCTVEAFRGIASGRARIAFNGHMIVRGTARGTDTQQSLRSLLEGSDAEADLRPQLEIYTDEVRASHGATVGKLDENMLFYLLSRGIDRETAEGLLKWAFLSEVLTRIDIPQLRAEAQQLLLGRMQGLSIEVAP